MNKRWPLIASFVLFILLCVSLAYWGLQLFQPPPRPVAAPPRAAAPEIRPQAAAALFGGRTDTVAASNYQLHGVIYAGNPRDSVVIISSDGKPAQAVRAGSEVVPGVTIKEVHRGFVLLAENGVTKRVDLPEEAPPSVASNAPVPVRPLPRTPIPRPRPAPPVQAPAAPVPQQNAPGTPGGQSGFADSASGAGEQGGDGGVTGAAERARAQRDSGQQPGAGDTSGNMGQQEAPAQFAPGAGSSVVVNPGGGVSTGSGEGQNGQLR